MMKKLEKKRVARSICSYCGEYVYEDQSSLCSIRSRKEYHVSCYLKMIGVPN